MLVSVTWSGGSFGSWRLPNFLYNMCMMNEIATTSEETTAYSIGYTIATLLNLKRMVEQNMTDYSSNPEGMRGMLPMWSKQEVMEQFDRAIGKLNTITYPYKV